MKVRHSKTLSDLSKPTLLQTKCRASWYPIFTKSDYSSMKADRQRLVNELDQVNTSLKDLAERGQNLAQENISLIDELKNSRDVSQKLISQMQSTHEEILLAREVQYKDVREQLEDKDKFIAALKAENCQLLSKYDTLQVDKNNSQAELWQTEKERFEHKIQQLEAHIEQLRVFETQNADLQQTVKELGVERQNLSTEINTLKHFQTKANENRQQLTEELLIIRNSASELASSKEQLQELVALSQTQISNLQSEAADLKTQIGELRKGLADANNKLSDANLLLNERQATIDQLNSVALQNQGAVIDRRQDLQTISNLQEEAEQLKLKLEDKDAKLSRATSLFEEYSETVEALQAIVRLMTQKSAKLTAQLKEVSRLAESNRSETEAVRALLVEEGKASSELRVQLELKDAELLNLNSQLQRTSEEKNSLNQALEEKCKAFEAAQMRLTEAGESIDEKNIELDDIRNRFGMKEAEVKEITDQLKKHKAMLKLMELKEEKEKSAHKDSLNQEMQKIEELTKSNEQLLEHQKQLTAENTALTSERQKLERELEIATESAELEKSLADKKNHELNSTIKALRETQVAMEKQIAEDKDAVDRLNLQKNQIELRETEHLQTIADLTAKLDEITARNNSALVLDTKQQERDSLSILQTPSFAETRLAAANQALTTEHEQLLQRVNSLTNKLQQKTDLISRVVPLLRELQNSVHSLRSEVDSSSICMRQLKEKTLFETPEFIALYTQQLEQKVNKKSKHGTSSTSPNPLLQMKEKIKDDILEELHQSLNFEQLLTKFEQLNSRNPNLSSNQLLIHNLNQNPNQPSGIRVDSALNPAPTTGSNEKQLPAHTMETTDKKKKPKIKAVSTTKRPTSKRSQLGALLETNRGENAEGEDQDEQGRSVSKTPNPDREYLGKRKTSDIKKRLEADFADLKKKGTAKPIRDDGLRNLTNLTGGEIEPIILKSERKRPLEQHEPVGRIVPEMSSTQKADRSPTPDESSRKKKSQ